MQPRHVTLDGWISYELRSRAGLIVQAGEQHNLLLNQGLDLLATYGFSGLAQYACVGTGTTDPAVGQTALIAEVARTASAPTGDTITRVSNGVYDFTFTRDFGYSAANGNLTEWGLAAASTGGLAVCERFRDGSNNPVVVTKTSDQQLRLTYTLRVTLSPVAWTAGSWTLAGVGMLAGRTLLMGGGSGPSGRYDLRLVSGLLTGSTYLFFGLAGDMSASSYTDDLGRYPAESTTANTLTAAGYTPGTFTRGGTVAAWTAGQVVGTWSSVVISADGNSGNSNGLAYVWDANDGVTCSKSSTQTLSITGPALTWARA
ncbi:hypothetical protein GO986_21755 [Deinococcus sp. HMF7620]|uniref:Uncharacterized protein n=1 Tax=Deinococcus arboris TaxID=2682977 RepID=A0A7C9MTY3_9DEIO|nr:hypothetical protein [Deinococcus arboris]MVN89364.1 hypothetical protein [Deinococcus arboris]